MQRLLLMPQLVPTTVVEDEITLRPWSEADVDSLVRRINDPDVAKFLVLVPQPYTVQDAHDWVAIAADGWRDGTSASFGVHVTGVDGAAGGVGIRFLADIDAGCGEIGYWVGADARGRGVATAATRAAARWAFESVPELARLQLRADVENVASNRVAAKAGFTREGVLRSMRYDARLGRRVDFVMWSLLREEL
jgi:RimJ/RimL family protein N-acetyltransferase